MEKEKVMNDVRKVFCKNSYLIPLFVSVSRKVFEKICMEGSKILCRRIIQQIRRGSLKEYRHHKSV